MSTRADLRTPTPDTLREQLSPRDVRDLVEFLSRYGVPATLLGVAAHDEAQSEASR